MACTNFWKLYVQLRQWSVWQTGLGHSLEANTHRHWCPAHKDLCPAHTPADP